MAFLAQYWKAAAIIALLAGYSGVMFHAGKVYEHSKWQGREAIIRNEEAEACNKAKEITKHANDTLQRDRDSIARKLAALRMQPARCIPITRTP